MVGVVLVVMMVGVGVGEVDFGVAADRAWSRIEKEYFIPESGQFRESTADDSAAFNWTVGVTLSAMNGLALGSTERKKKLVSYLKSTEAYWNSRGPVAGFDVVPLPSGVDRYYDDNAWMVLALLESWRVTGDQKVLSRGEEALKFVLSGEDGKLGGGIFWREKEKTSKNTCSNSPSAVACFEMYEATGRREYLEAGLRILGWVMGQLCDPADGLMWDNVTLGNVIEKTKWSYNTGLTVRALKYAEGKGRKYAVGSKAMFEAAWTKWADGKGGLSGPGKFSHLLFEAGLKCGYLSREQIRVVAERVLELGKGGPWGESLDGRGRARGQWNLIDEASAVRVLVLADRALKTKDR